MSELRKRRSSAEDMAKSQKEISVSEFFAKNRHMLGFDNPRKALLTTVKEAVDNSLDACEEAGILPEVWVQIEAVGKDKYKVASKISPRKPTRYFEIKIDTDNRSRNRKIASNVPSPHHRLLQ